MRFEEFNITEAKQSSLYAVGDSHAQGIATNSSGWVNLSQAGAKAAGFSTGVFSKIPQGSVVALSLGHNDAIGSKDTPDQIANQVASAVDAATSKKLKVYFILFPTGDDKNTFKRNEEVRVAIYNKVSSKVSAVYDLNRGAMGPDKIHAASASYAMLGNYIHNVESSFGSTQPLVPLATDSVTQGRVGQVLNFIARYESGGRYNALVGRNKNAALDKMSIADVLKLQANMKAQGHESTAVGRYQYIASTLRNTVAKMGLNPNTTMFTPQTQDQIAIYTLRTECSLDKWLAGTLKDDQFLHNLSRIWAAIPDPSRGGQSHYQGVGSNTAGLGVNTALNTLQNIKTA